MFPRAPTLTPVGVDCAERLAGVLEHPEAVSVGEPLELGQRRREAEDVHREDPRGALAETAASAAAGSMLRVSGSTSQKTGLAPS